jgi:hypothetical protein
MRLDTAGVPGLSVPSGQSHNGMSISLQVIKLLSAALARAPAPRDPGSDGSFTVPSGTFKTSAISLITPISWRSRRITASPTDRRQLLQKLLPALRWPPARQHPFPGRAEVAAPPRSSVALPSIVDSVARSAAVRR